MTNSSLNPLRKITPSALALTKFFEGLSLEAYLDPGGIPTIGYGHTGEDVHMGMDAWTEEEAATQLQIDMFNDRRAVAKYVTVNLTDNQFGALCDFCYNVGSGNFQKSTLLLLLNRGWYQQVPIQLLRWDKDKQGDVLNGLYKRRVAEGKLWNTTDPPNTGATDATVRTTSTS